MGIQKQKIALLAFLLAGAVLFCTFFSLITRADDSLPTLYCNDEVWYKATIVPLRIYHSVYVPISVFEQLEGVTVTLYERNNTAMISRSDTLYISFDFTRNSASVRENERFYLMTYTEGEERYVPLVTTCEYLDLQWETHTSVLDGSISARICDGRQNKTFEELLRRYNPAALDGKTEPPETTAPDQPIDPVGSTLFLTVDGLGDGGRIPALLDLLEEFDVKAAFFITSTELVEKENLVLSILAGGHTLGLLVSEEGAAAELAEANQRLMERFKLTSRLYRLQNDDHADDIHSALRELGYAVWGYHLDLGMTEDSVRQTLTDFRRAIKIEGDLILRVRPDGFNTVGYLREFFLSAQGKRTFSHITFAYYAAAA